MSTAEIRPRAQRVAEQVREAGGALDTEVEKLSAAFGFPRISARRRVMIENVLAEVGVVVVPSLLSADAFVSVRLELAGDRAAAPASGGARWEVPEEPLPAEPPSAPPPPAQPARLPRPATRGPRARLPRSATRGPRARAGPVLPAAPARRAAARAAHHAGDRPAAGGGAP